MFSFAVHANMPCNLRPIEQNHMGIIHFSTVLNYKFISSLHENTENYITIMWNKRKW